jgi:hypothetical protein
VCVSLFFFFSFLFHVRACLLHAHCAHASLLFLVHASLDREFDLDRLDEKWSQKLILARQQSLQ